MAAGDAATLLERVGGALGRGLRLPLDLLVPPACLGCRSATSAAALCSDCRALLVPAGEDPGIPHAVLVDEGPAARLVRHGKHGRSWRVGPAMAELTAALCETRLLDLAPEAVTWVPHDERRGAARGLHLPQLYATALARRLDLPAVALLARRAGAAQRGADLTTRRHNVDGAFHARTDAYAWAGRTLLLVDDVVTTGATFRAARRALGDAGVVAEPLAFVGVPRRHP